jgi:hypothetical protein
MGFKGKSSAGGIGDRGIGGKNVNKKSRYIIIKSQRYIYPPYPLSPIYYNLLVLLRNFFSLGDRFRG